MANLCHHFFRCKADGSLSVAACEKPATLEAEQAAADAEHAKVRAKMSKTSTAHASFLHKVTTRYER